MVNMSTIDPERYMKITSSTAPTVCGLDTYLTPWQAKLIIIGEHVAEYTEVMARGHYLEDGVMKWSTDWLIKNGVLSDGDYLRQCERRNHPTVKHFSDSCDYHHDDFLVECKTASVWASKKYGEELTDDVPEYVYGQAHWHLIHWPEMKRVYIPLLTSGSFEFKMYVVERDEEVEADMLYVARKWYKKYIIDDNDPPAEAGDDEALKKRYPSRRGARESERVLSSSEIARLTRAYEQYRTEVKRLTDEQNGIKNQLKQLIGDREGYFGDWGKVRWYDKRNGVDWYKLAQAVGVNEALCEQFKIVDWKKLCLDGLNVTDRQKDMFTQMIRTFEARMKE